MILCVWHICLEIGPIDCLSDICRTNLECCLEPGIDSGKRWEEGGRELGSKGEGKGGGGTSEVVRGEEQGEKKEDERQGDVREVKRGKTYDEGRGGEEIKVCKMSDDRREEIRRKIVGTMRER